MSLTEHHPAYDSSRSLIPNAVYSHDQLTTVSFAICCIGWPQSDLCHAHGAAISLVMHVYVHIAERCLSGSCGMRNELQIVSVVIQRTILICGLLIAAEGRVDPSVSCTTSTT